MYTVNNIGPNGPGAEWGLIMPHSRILSAVKERCRRPLGHALCAVTHEKEQHKELRFHKGWWAGTLIPLNVKIWGRD